MTENEQLLENLENQDNQADIGMAEDELTLLKDRAKLMGIKFSNNIGIESLREKIAAKVAGDEVSEEEPTNKVNPLAVVGTAQETPPVKEPTLRETIVKEQMRLIRLRIQNLDPKKKDLPGEVLCVANEYLGTVKKYIPYGEASDEGYHVPYCIYTELESRRFQNVRTYTDKATGQIRIDSSWVREFSLEILPPLTQTELTQLASAQAAAGNK
jgi:hypothetical protein